MGYNITTTQGMYPATDMSFLLFVSEYQPINKASYNENQMTKAAFAKSMFGDHFNYVVVLTLLAWMVYTLPSVQAAIIG